MIQQRWCNEKPSYLIFFSNKSIPDGLYKNIQSIILNDGSTLNRSDLSSVIYSEDQIDYLTLKNGSKVEGLEVKKINYSKKLILAPQVRAAVRVGGDGTGG